jgi:hypothetical protein
LLYIGYSKEERKIRMIKSAKPKDSLNSGVTRLDSSASEKNTASDNNSMGSQVFLHGKKASQSSEKSRPFLIRFVDGKVHLISLLMINTLVIDKAETFISI